MFLESGRHKKSKKTFFEIFLTIFSRYNSNLLHYIRKISNELLYVESIETVLKLSHGFN